MWQNLKKKLKAMIAANTNLQEVYDYEVEEFGGDPCATLVPSSNESDYRTTSSNRRVYAFNLTLWVKRGGQYRNDSQAENVLTDLVDQVLDYFDKYYTLGGASAGTLTLPTGYTVIMVEATPSQWVYSNRETLYRGAEIKIRVHVDVNVTLIS